MLGHYHHHFMIAIELMIQKEIDAPAQAAGKIWKLEVPAIPQRGDWIRLWECRNETLCEVSQICFEERIGEPCAVLVFVKRL
jgi:hypothetical protein